MKKAFTLIELIAVLIVIGVLGLIVTFTVDKVIKENQEKLYTMQVDNIITSAKVWAGKHALDLPSENGQFILKTLQDLMQEGLLEENIENPKTGEIYEPSKWAIKITKVNSNYQYELLKL